MPSPVAHGLAGIVSGWLIDPPPRLDRRGMLQRSAMFAGVAMAPDLDLLFGAHSGPTHGLGAAIVAGMLSWWVLRQLEWRSPAVTACAVALAFASHTLLDWLGTDASPPIGIMALWPFSRGYYESHLHVFMAISRRYWLEGFWDQNLRAFARELAILLPLAALVVLMRRRRAEGR